MSEESKVSLTNISLNEPLADYLYIRAVAVLRTVPTFVSAHTFCASRDTRVSFGWCLPIQRYFCAV